jgi:16S rRNA processing protein RimM
MVSGSDGERLIVVGEIAGLYGVKGWVRVRSFTDPVGNIMNYQPWHIDHGGVTGPRRVEQVRQHGAGVVARLAGLEDRESARALIGAEILVLRSQFPAAVQQEYYWADLVGMQVKNAQGLELGVVVQVMSTGANDVLVLKGERRRLVPFIVPDTVRRVDLRDRVIEVNWDADF